jgi:hypothetical protein
MRQVLIASGNRTLTKKLSFIVDLPLMATSHVRHLSGTDSLLDQTISHYRFVEKLGGRGHGYGLFKPFWYS